MHEIQLEAEMGHFIIIFFIIITTKYIFICDLKLCCKGGGLVIWSYSLSVWINFHWFQTFTRDLLCYWCHYFCGL